MLYINFLLIYPCVQRVFNGHIGTRHFVFYTREVVLSWEVKIAYLGSQIVPFNERLLLYLGCPLTEVLLLPNDPLLLTFLR